MNEPQTFRKKPVEIQAMQWTGGPESARPIVNWARGEGAKVRYFGDPERLEVDTLEGTMRMRLGDFLIRGVQGEFYPCKPDIFEQAYERVGGA